MSSLKYLHWTPAKAPALTPHPARQAAAALLRGASAWLARMARRLGAAAAEPARSAPRLEFYAEAGAPEGALYLDGQLIGHIQGLKRL